MLGVSDEHFYGWAQGKARGGLWVRALTRDGVREAMEARRFYATMEPGLRLDAAANGAQMGSTLGHRDGHIRLELDIDGGQDSYGRPLSVQVLASGGDQPVVVHAADITIASPSEPLVPLDFDHTVDNGRWLLLRVTDPAVEPTNPTPDPFKRFGRAVAYASPWFLDPDAAQLSATPVPAATAPAPAGGTSALPATGPTTSTGLAMAMAAAALAARRLTHHHHEH